VEPLLEASIAPGNDSIECNPDAAAKKLLAKQRRKARMKFKTSLNKEKVKKADAALESFMGKYAAQLPEIGPVSWAHQGSVSSPDTPLWGATALQPTYTREHIEEDIRDGMIPHITKSRRNVVLLISYCGKDFSGLQHSRQEHVVTIEDVIMDALQSLGLISAAERDCPPLFGFQRASRTDKRVSAARNVLSLRLPAQEILGREAEWVSRLNGLLPAAVRVMEMRHVTPAFNCKGDCDYRTYSYLAPSFAFAPPEALTNHLYRIDPPQLEEVRGLFSQLEGTKNFHNFTKGKLPTDQNAWRTITSIVCSDPFERDGFEWLHIHIKGTSFMLHQIRKVVGCVMHVTRGLWAPSVIPQLFSDQKITMHKAPGLGLVLEQPHYDWYSQSNQHRGLHMEWSSPELAAAVEQFRRTHIDSTIVATERAEASMLLHCNKIHNACFEIVDGELRGRKPHCEDDDD